MRLRIHGERPAGRARLEPGSWWFVASVVAGAALLVAGVAVLLGPVAWWLGGHTVASLTGRARADAINGVRQVLLGALVGIAAAGGLYFTARTYALSRAGQVTDRFSTAVEHLGSQVAAQQLGGVYALERLMRDSAADHPTVVEVLTAFVRDKVGHGADWYPRPEASTTPLPSGVQAALTVLGRRPRLAGERQLDLARTSMCHAFLNEAALPGVNLSKSDLRHVHFYGAQLQGARMGGSLLTAGHLRHAHLDGAHLGGARLEGADLSGASLARAMLKGACYDQRTKLDGADLRGARLGGARGLTAAHLAKAVVDRTTRLPDGLAWTAEAGVQPAAPSGGESPCAVPPEPATTSR